MEEPWRILEFYSGIGGMRYSLLKGGIRGEVIQAFDINNVANDVYQHNFGHRPFQGNIQSLTAAKLDEYGAHAWLLSPPCQPYTRQGLRKQSADARAFSFVKILELIPRMLQSPTIIFVENVVGFETSDTHGQMMEILSRTEFIVQEFILSPLQFGVPYSRPRYFCLAKKKPLSFPNPSLNGQLLRTPIPLRTVVSTRWMDGSNHHEGEEEEFCEPIRNFLETSPLYNCKSECTKCSSCRESNDSIVHGNDNTSSVSIVDSTHEDGIYMISDNTSKKTSGSCDLMNALDAYYVPLSLIDRWGNVMDIVYPDSKRCCCFTKSYYRYVKGTGSLLATVGNRDSTSTNYHEISSLKMLGLRYFTPQEVANMHSFPRDFWFPPHICIRQHFSTARMFHMRMSNDLEILIKSITRGWMELAQWKKQMKQREDITVHHPVVCRSIGCEDKIKIMKSNPRESRT